MPALLESLPRIQQLAEEALLRATAAATHARKILDAISSDSPRLDIQRPIERAISEIDTNAVLLSEASDVLNDYYGRA